MKCAVRREGVEMGEFPLEELQTKVLYGTVREGDEFRYEGSEEWKPISLLPPSPELHLQSEKMWKTPVFWVLVGFMILVGIIWTWAMYEMQTTGVQ